jgi:hypothetical protein
MLTTPATKVSPDDTARLCQKLDQCGVLDTVQETYAACVETGSFGLDDKGVDCVIVAPSCDVMFERCGLTLPATPDLCAQACTKMKDCGLLTPGGWTEAECREHCPQLYLAGELQCLLTLNDCRNATDACFSNIGASIQKFLSDFWENIATEMAKSLAVVQAQPDNFSFDIKKYNVALLDLPWQPSLSGRHDYTDTLFFSSTYSGMDALLSTMLALDININPALLQMILTMPSLSIDFTNPGPEDIAQIVAFLQWLDGVLDVILHDPIYSSFLTIQEPDGAATFQHVGLQIGQMFGALADMIEEVKTKGADPESPIRFLDQNGDGEWNPPEPLIIPGVVQMEYDLAFAVHDLLLALKVDYVDGYAFRFDSLSPLFDYFNLAWVNGLIEALDLVGVDGVDLGATFREPDPEGLRPLLADAQVVIEKLIELLSTSR